MKRKLNASGEKEMIVHMATVRKARKELSSDAKKLAKQIANKMAFALTQDARIMRNMQKADKK